MTPAIVARCVDGKSIDPRADTELRFDATMELWAAEGRARVKLYKSRGDCDRGGYVLRLEIEYAGGWLPFAKLTPTGVELHLAGDEEADAMLTLLRRALLEQTFSQCAESYPDDIQAELGGAGE